MSDHPLNRDGQSLLRKLFDDAIVKAFTAGTYGKFGLTFTVENGIFSEAEPVTQPRVRLSKSRLVSETR